MKNLIINNGSTFLNELKDWVGECDVIEYGEECHTEPYDVIILSGGHNHSIMNHQAEFQKEIDLIQQIPKAIIGICLGFELIVTAFGGMLTHLDHAEHGMYHVESKSEKLWPMKTFAVFESHKWGITEVKNNLEILAESQYGIEAVSILKNQSSVFSSILKF